MIVQRKNLLNGFWELPMAQGAIKRVDRFSGRVMIELEGPIGGQYRVTMSVEELAQFAAAAEIKGGDDVPTNAGN